MADERPPRPGAAPASSIFNRDHLQDTFIFLIVLILLGAVANRFIYYFQSDSLPIATLWDALAAWFGRLWHFWKFVAVPLIGASLWWALYSRMKRRNIEKEEESIYSSGSGAEALSTAAIAEKKVNEKWGKVIEHINSTSSSDWRLAIIEADIMLDELLTVNGYHGDSIGDKLKAVEPSDMLTLDAAWEAHKVRNRIAHAGSDFELNEREAKRVIALFEKIFKEFQII